MSRYVGTELCLGILHNCYFFGPRSQIPCLTPFSLRGKFEKVTITYHFRFAIIFEKFRFSNVSVYTKTQSRCFQIPSVSSCVFKCFRCTMDGAHEMLYFPSPTSPFGSIPAALSSSVYFPLSGWFFSISLLYFQSKI